MNNILALTDSYCHSFPAQYPPNTNKVYAYFECRGGEFKESTFFGLQYIIKKWLTGPLFNKEDLEYYREFYKKHFGQDDVFNYKGWKYILEKYNGCLPIKIKAVPEGFSIPTSNILLSVENTDPQCFWLVSYVQIVLTQVWAPTTVCTLSREYKKILLKYLEETGDPSTINFKLHCFGFRGVSSVETAGICGAAHIVNFMGTDTIPAIETVLKYYNRNNEDWMPAFSIPASEHACIVSHGRDQERNAYENILDKFPTGLVACVSDSYNIFNAVENIWGSDLKEKIEKRNGTLVIRLDSGDPVDTVIKVLDILKNKFDGAINSKGYFEFFPYLRILQGDGINLKSMTAILEAMKQKGYSANCIGFGSGGALLQKVNRDTLSCAYKASWIDVDGVGRDVWKDPITDTGKRSKRGRLALIRRNGVFTTVSEAEAVGERDCLIPVFENGKLLADQDFKDIRARSNE